MESESLEMQEEFWEQLDLFKKTGTELTPDSVLVRYYPVIYEIVKTKMHGEFGDKFVNFVGSDGRHDGLCDFIIWSGRDVFEKFITDPSNASSLAKIMNNTPEFDDNPLRGI